MKIKEKITETRNALVSKRGQKALFKLSFGMMAVNAAVIVGGTAMSVFASGGGLAGSELGTTLLDFFMDVYNMLCILSFATAAASFALKGVVSHFSSDPQSIARTKEAQKWIIISAVAINGLGFIFRAIEPYIENGQLTNADFTG